MVDSINGNSFGETQHPKPLGRWHVFSYGAGHMLNDITSSCWFTYLLLFLAEMGISPRDASIVMLSGQIADALATIFAGELIDWFGHFKLWHLGGSLFVAFSFSSVFGGCVLCKILGSNSWTLQTIGYSISAAIFNVGWAITQVSHMSMATFISLDQTNRVSLTSCRNAFTMVANLCLYAIAFSVFSLHDAMSPEDIELQYQWIAYLSILIGSSFVVIFLAGTKEPVLRQQMNEINNVRISWAHWFKKILYFQVALVYLLMRLVTNVSQALVAMYVINDLEMPQSAKALVPAITYVSSFLVSIILQEIRWSSFRLKACCTGGAILWTICGSLIFILPHNMHNLMYLLSAVIGVANALLMVAAISMESILVGEDLNGCAFVYGSLSFLDKLSCGLALYVLESYEGSLKIKGCFDIQHCQSISRYGAGLIPAICAFLSIFVVLAMDFQDRRTPLHLEEQEPLLVS